MTITERDFDYPNWNVKDYTSSEVNISVTRMKLEGAKSDLLGVFVVSIEYCIEKDYSKIFNFSADKMYLFDPFYKSFHFIAFLTDVAIKEFDTAFLKMKEISGTTMETIDRPNVADLSDEIMDAMLSIPSQDIPKS